MPNRKSATADTKSLLHGDVPPPRHRELSATADSRDFYHEHIAVTLTSRPTFHYCRQTVSRLGTVIGAVTLLIVSICHDGLGAQTHAGANVGLFLLLPSLFCGIKPTDYQKLAIDVFAAAAAMAAASVLF